MSINITRRDFLKCAGITVLAVGAGGLLTGCEDGGGSGTAGINTPQTIKGITVKVTGYEEEKVTAGIAGITVTDDNRRFLFPEVTVTNKNETVALISSASNFVLKVDGKEQTYPTSATASAAALLYKHPLLDQDTGYRVPAGKTRSGALAYIVPKDWKKVELRFMPDPTKPSQYVTFVINHK